VLLCVGILVCSDKRFRSFEAFKGRLHEILDEFSPPNAFDQDTTVVTLKPTATENKIAISPEVVTASDETITKAKHPPAMQEQFFNGEQGDALMFASLLGAWNEKVEGDRDAITKLIEKDD
jgi:hypothetical protein